MRKITVKHYHNLDVKTGKSEPYIMDEKGEFIISEEDSLYPVYLQITVNRKTTKLRSFTNRILSKEDFEEYIKNGSFDGEKHICKGNIHQSLKQEIIDVTNALNYFYNIKKGNQDKYPIRSVAEFYMHNIDSPYLRTLMNNETLQIDDDSKYTPLFDIIQEDVNPVKLIDTFKNQLNIDIYTLLDKYFNNQDAYKAYELFFRVMPQDKEGKIIGRLINWYNGDLKDIYKKKISKMKNAEILFSSLDSNFDYFERYRI